MGKSPLSPRPGATRTRTYLKGLGSGYVATLATILVGLWLTPFTLRFLDREEYAVFTLASDLLMWLGMLDLGVTAGLNVQAAQLSGRPDPERLNRLASTAFFTQNGIVLGVIIVGAGIAVGFPHFFQVREELRETSSNLMALLVAGSAIGFSTKTFSALLVAHQQIHIDNLLRLGMIGLRTILTVLLLNAGWGLYSLGVATLAASVTTSALAVLRTRSALPGLRIKWSYASWVELRGIGALGIWFSLGGLAGLLIVSMDRVLVGKLFTVESVTTLSLTGRVYALASSVLEQITNTARPMIGQMLGQGRMTDVARLYQTLFKVCGGVAVLLATSLWVGNGAFVTVWVGENHYGGAALNAALAANLLTNTWVLPNRAVLASAMLVRAQTICRLLEAVVNLGASIMLGHQFGMIGIVIGTTVGGVMTSVWYLPLLTARFLGRRVCLFWLRDASAVMAVAICLVPVAWGARSFALHYSGPLPMLFASGITGIAGLGLILAFCLDDSMKSKLRNLKRKRIS